MHLYFRMFEKVARGRQTRLKKVFMLTMASFLVDHYVFMLI